MIEKFNLGEENITIRRGLTRLDRFDRRDPPREIEAVSYEG